MKIDLLEQYAQEFEDYLKKASGLLVTQEHIITEIREGNYTKEQKDRAYNILAKWNRLAEGAFK